MDSMTLKCPVTIKAKVTEDLKKQLASEIQNNIKKTDLELQQIEFQAKRIMAEQAKQDMQGLEAVRQQIDAETKKRLDFKNHLVDQLKESGQLEIGAEIVQGTLERIVEIKVGDEMPQIMNAEILVEDGKIIAFRN
ncbi:YlqD protein [Propionispira arboris]|uniref:YlqD protein n=1 Tax=Propionispira arboris TaxID=84035 RepID=A0A1H6W7H6_9FIRM|nr:MULTISPECIES: YlqD family protein [Propionispira]SEJ08235.1 YlqD protein [Propionispira arboris]